MHRSCILHLIHHASFSSFAPECLVLRLASRKSLFFLHLVRQWNFIGKLSRGVFGFLQFFCLVVGGKREIRKYVKLTAATHVEELVGQSLIQLKLNTGYKSSLY